MKIYLGLITASETKNMDELTGPIWEHIDGIISVVDDREACDETARLLEGRKKGGAVIRAPWANDHDMQMNRFLRAGIMRNGDFFFIRDSMERFNVDFAKNIRKFTKLMVDQKVLSIFSHGKSFGHVFFDDMIIFGSPHWGIQGARPLAIDLKDHFSKERDYAYRLHDGEEGGRPLHNFIDHEAKYYFEYGRSNHLLLGRENKIEEYQDLERDRTAFRLLCAERYGVELNIEGLKKILRSEDWKNDVDFLRIFKKQPILLSFYRWHVLETPLDQINNSKKDFIYV
jgi:hypothetical protein